MTPSTTSSAGHADDEVKPEVVGDSAYADGETRDRLAKAGYTMRVKQPPVCNRAGRYSKDRFQINLDDNTVTCPAGHTVTITPSRRGGGKASFATHCGTCPLRKHCTAARRGRSITIHRHEARLQAARAEQAVPEWVDAYRADRPIVERKIAHYTRRLWGGRKARCRGLIRISTDVDTRAAAINLARLAILGVAFDGAGWASNSG